MKDLEKTIKHFESQQKRYKTQHDGRACERIEDALEALRYFNAARFIEEQLKKHGQAIFGTYSSSNQKQEK